MSNDVFANHSSALIKKGALTKLYSGVGKTLESLEELRAEIETNPEIVFALPFNTVRENGYMARGNAPIRIIIPRLVLSLTDEELDNILRKGKALDLGEITSSISDEAFQDIVRDVISEEIGGGEVSQVNISRSFSGQIPGFTQEHALSLYAKLANKAGCYITYMVNFRDNDTAERDFTLVGASPECHIHIDEEHTSMTPIAGTMAKTQSIEQDLSNFAGSKKLREELIQVTEEEIKLMARITGSKPWLEGPFLRDAGSIFHTEYHIHSKRPADVFDALKKSLFMPTVTGSPFKNAYRVIERREPTARDYYTGIIGTARSVASQITDIDSAILIRTMEIDGAGNFKIQAGGGITRDSIPAEEANENRSKANSIISILSTTQSSPISYEITDTEKAEYAAILQDSNSELAATWFAPPAPAKASTENAAKKVTLINNEDDFIYLLEALLKEEGISTEVIEIENYNATANTADLTILGPGPGDVNDLSNPRMERLNSIFNALNGMQRNIFGVCLGHQAICRNIGYEVRRQDTPTQGTAKKTYIHSEEKIMGFYNSFSPVFDSAVSPSVPVDEMDIQDGRIQTIFADGGRIKSIQAHPESLLSKDGAKFLIEETKQQLGL